MFAAIGSNGSCTYEDFVGVRTTWETPRAYGEAWLAEWRGPGSGPAAAFLNEVTCAPHEQAVALIAMIAELAAGDSDALGGLGRGPLEALVSHYGHGADVIDEVERWAAQPAFGRVCASVCLGRHVDADVRARMAALGAQDLTAQTV